MNACILIIMSHQLHCGGHIIVALRLLRETGSLDQLFPISHLLCSRAVGSHRVRSFLSRTHSVVRERALRTAHSARAESGPAAHVRVERRAKCWRCRFVFFCLSIYFITRSFPSQPSISSKFRPNFVPVGLSGCCCKRPVNPSEQGGGGSAHSLYFRMTSFSKNSHMLCSRAPAQWGLLQCSMQRHSARARDK